MYSLQVVFGPASAAWGFLFKAHKNAMDAYTALTNSAAPVDASPFISPRLEIRDDFGQTASIHVAEVHGVLLEDMDETAKSVIERTLHQARTQIRANQQARQDATIKTEAQLSGMMGGQMPMNGPHFRPGN